MRHLLKDTYFPFGSQYYRAPSPMEQDWEEDLKNMSELGFNTVKFWVQWRWNNPAEGEYYFDDIDRLMELASKYNLKVMLNTIFDVAPAWIYTKYPDASMVTLSGRKIGPQTQPHRQIGGLGYCFNHDEVIDHMITFLKETVKRYKDHPALEIWNVASEPELTSSMAEMRLYADNAEKIGDMLCYCDHCQTKFKIWLNYKYGDIKTLNTSWNRNYRSFDEVELPKTRNTFNDVIDWRMFFVHTIGENVKRRFEAAHEADNRSHPLMCHHVFVQGFPVTSTASDPWNVGKYGDLHGFTQMDDAMMIDVLRSCAKGKPVISAEMLMLPGYTLDMPQFIDSNDVKRLIFRGVAGNLKGFIFWQYRPEILGREAPTWGLTTLDGKPTSWLKAFSETGLVLQKNADFLLDAKPLKAEVAILYDPENEVFAWASTGNEKTATNSLLGVHRALYEHNYAIDFIHPMEFDWDVLKNYKVLYIPFPYYLGEKICRALENWVSEGGILIGEAYFAGWNVEHGHHERVIPGYGMDKVFKARQGVVEPASRNTVAEIDIIKDLSFQRKGEKIKEGISKEAIRFQAGTAEPLGGSSVEMEVIKDMPYLSEGDKVRGTIVKETLISEGAEVIARYATGEAAVTQAEYGKGKAILIGSYVGLSFFRNENLLNGELIASLVEMNAEVEKPYVYGNHKVRADLLKGKDGRSMLIIQNLKHQTTEVMLRIPLKGVKSMKEQFTAEELNLIQEPELEASVTSVKLEGKEVRVYCA
ncbi:MAG TPA: beta-galactosidase [Ignavibacteriales bacterium]|nr:beta-galactosidase [Ignavibacteriales bacterium]